MTRIETITLDPAKLPEQLPEIAYIGNDLCFVRRTKKTKLFPLEVVFAFKPMSIDDHLIFRKYLRDSEVLQKDGDHAGAEALDTEQTRRLITHHVKDWSMPGPGGKKMEINEQTATAIPIAVAREITADIVASTFAVEDVEKKSTEPSDSQPSTPDGSDSTARSV